MKGSKKEDKIDYLKYDKLKKKLFLIKTINIIHKSKVS